VRSTKRRLEAILGRFAQKTGILLLPHEEFEKTIRTPQEQMNVSPQPGLKLFSRAPVLHQRKAGRRHKIASTSDGALHDRIRVAGLSTGAFYSQHLQNIDWNTGAQF
jgi:hypothetical protein